MKRLILAIALACSACAALAVEPDIIYEDAQSRYMLNKMYVDCSRITAYNTRISLFYLFKSSLMIRPMFGYVHMPQPNLLVVKMASHEKDDAESIKNSPHWVSINLQTGAIAEPIETHTIDRWVQARCISYAEQELNLNRR